MSTIITVTAQPAEGLLDRMFESLDIVLWSIDPATGQALYCSPGAEKVYGQNPAAFLKDPTLWKTYVHPEDRPAMERLEQDLLSGQASSADYRLLLRDGTLKWVTTRGFPVMDGDGRLKRVDGIVADVTKRKRAEEALAFQAQHDSLTGLPNRTLLLKLLNQYLVTADNDRMVGLFMIDLNGFKLINDSFGHLIGDSVLQEVGKRFQANVRPADTVARLGGDEFAVVLPDLTNIPEAGQAAARLVSCLEEPLLVNGLKLNISASLGVALAPLHAAEPVELMRLADNAMYRAKSARTGFALAISDEAKVVTDWAQLARELGYAIESRQLRLHYQPVVDPYTRQVQHLEALVRWEHPERGIIPPGEFIGLAERSGIVRAITAWVLDEALGQLVAWEQGGLDVAVAVNVSVQHLQDVDFVEQIAAVLERWGVSPDKLRLEVTERGLITNLARVRTVADGLEAIGVRLAIDDLGTGQASLNYLHDFSAQQVKIDKSYIAAIHETAWGAALVRSIIDMAGALEKTVVAEGVEDEETLAFLMRTGCDAIQGYVYSPPVPACQIPDLLRGISAGEKLTARGSGLPVSGHTLVQQERANKATAPV